MPSERVQRRIDSLLDVADASIENRDLEAAAQAVRMVLRIDPDNEDALTFAAMLDGEVNETVSTSPATAPDTPSADEPQSFADGRYEVKRFLGEGGKKKVYLAHDTTLDRDVAFALIKMDGLDETGRTRITREAQAMGRLGTHPNVVAVLDIGEHEGQPWMVNELLGGGDVEGLIEDAEGPLNLPRALEIAADTCRGLQFAHEQGIIHRDIKPANVWMTTDGTAKVGDYGLAIATDRSRLTQEKMMVGTVSYMPPEQATGGDITPKADLYSLGAMMYEMVAGRPPFLGDDDIAIIGQHINTPPVAPQWHNPQVSAQLDSLIMRLLSKNPAERPESAADVLSSIEAIDKSSSLVAQEGTVTGSLDSMAGGVFVGRQVEMDRLKAALENALSGRGGMVTLVGEPGIGKTRTSLELETYAGLRSAQVLWGRCYEGGGAPPYWPWVQAIRSYVVSHEPEQIRSQMGSTASVIAEIVEDIRQRVPDVQTPSHIDDADSARFRLFDSIATFLRTAGRVKPIVLILDDLHWADRPSLLLLEFVARELASSRVLVIGTYRDMELNRRHPLSITLGDLMRERLFERVLLRGLAKTDIARFIQIAAGATPPGELVDIVHAQTEGNPLFVTETVRLLVQEGDLTPERTERRDSWSVRIPEGVREVIGRRLDRLSERCNEVLTTAAIVGRQFRLSVIQKLVDDLTEDRLLDVLDEATDARIIEELQGEIGLYQFTHALMQETLTGELSLTRQVRMHAAIAVAMETEFGTQADHRAAELVPHFDRAQTILGADKLVHYAYIAGEQALSKNAFEDALSYFETARRCLADDEMDDQLADIEFGLARSKLSALSPEFIVEIFGHMQAAFDHYFEAGNIKNAIEVAILPLNARPGALVEALPMLEKIKDLVADDDPMRGYVLARYGQAIGRETADFERAAAQMDEALKIAEAMGDRELQIWTHTNAANSGHNHLQLDYAIFHGNRSLELAADPASPPIDRARAIVQQGLGLTAAGTIGAHVDMFRDGLKDAERSAVKPAIVEALWALGMALIANGELEEAMELNKRGLADYSTGGRLLSQRVQLETYFGNLDSAREHVIRLDRAAESTARNVAVRCIFAPCAAFYARISGDTSLLHGAIERTREVYEIANVGIAWVQQGVVGVGLIAIELGDLEICRDIYENAELTSGTTPIGVPMTVDRCLGVMATALGRFDEAAGHFQTSLDRSEDGKNVPEFAWVSSDYAEMLIQRGRAEDVETITKLQDQAIETARKYGITSLVERVLSNREILKA